MNERFTVIITRNQIEYLEKLANVEIVLSRQRSGDYDFIIREKEEERVIQDHINHRGEPS